MDPSSQHGMEPPTWADDHRLSEWLQRLLAADRQPSLAEHLEQIVLGGARCCDRAEIERRSGVPRARSRRLWRALGFADVDDDEVVFTDGDAQAISLVDSLVRSGLIDPAVESAVARAAGQSLARLAEWEIGLLNDYVVAQVGAGDLDVDEAAVLRAAELLLQTMEGLHSYVWRRHVAALTARALAVSPDEVVTTTLAVGFVDVVGYTRLSRQLAEEDLSRLLERFESMAGGAIAGGGGRLVKTIGDEVMFAANSPAGAATIALALLDAVADDDELPDVRIGMAWGRVLKRFGDLYGPVVNIASRLTSMAEPGRVLVARDLATALADDPGLQLRRRRAASVRGYQHLDSWRLRRTSDQQAGESQRRSRRRRSET